MKLYKVWDECVEIGELKSPFLQQNSLERVGAVVVAGFLKNNNDFLFMTRLNTIDLPFSLTNCLATSR